MKVELKIKGLKKTITISADNTKKLRDEYTNKLLDMEEFIEDKKNNNREKMAKTKEFFSWIEELSIDRSNLNDEDKEIVKNNCELSDILSNSMRRLLQPVPTEEKKN